MVDRVNGRPRIIGRPDGYEPTIARWVWALEDTRHRTVESLRGVTLGILDWQPPEGGHNIGTLLYHVAAIELSYLYEDILELGWSEELGPLLSHELRDAQGRLTAVRGESLGRHLARLDAARGLLQKALRAMDLDDFRRARLVEGQEVTPEWTLHHLMQHEAEHRGQMGEVRHRAEAAISV